MAAITPSTNVKLLKLPIELDNENQLTFANATAQYNYFNSLNKLAVDNFTYQRKDGVIRFPANVDDVIQYNYVMYQNTAFSNKWFYAYVDKMEFVNPGTTDVYIRTDPFQTWQFDITFQKSFVEREHVNDDTIGKHTVPEGLDLGEYEIQSASYLDLIDSNPPSGVSKWWICVSVTQPPYTDMNTLIPSFSHDVGDVPTGLLNFAIPIDSDATGSYASLRKILLFYNAEKQAGEGGTSADALLNIYLIPYTCVVTTDHQTWSHTYGSDTYSVTIYGIYPKISFSNAAVEQSTKLAENFSPINNKLYTYPFSYLYLSNKAGQNVVYKWEDGKTVTATTGKTGKQYKFDTTIVPSTSLSAKLYPTTYKTQTPLTVPESMWNYGVNFAKIPVSAWVTDYYTNWLTQNAVNMAAGVVGSTASSTVTGSYAGGVEGAAAMGVGSFVKSTIGALGETYKASTIPDQAHGDLNVGDALYAATKCSITAYNMTVRPEVATIVDNFFSMFGYKVNVTKIPNITGRANWNYVKTIRGKIHGYIPKEDLNAITEMLDNGVTFWHNASTFLDYSQSNAITT